MATKKQVSERNKLLWKVIRHIKAEPRRLDMVTWERSERIMGRDITSPCGTTACIFGWANLLGRKRPVNWMADGSDFFLSMCKLLSIDSREGDRLAYKASWPSKYRDKYNDAATTRGRASTTIRRIEHFIKTGE